MLNFNTNNKSFTQNNNISDVVLQWFIAVEKGDTLTLRSLIYPEYIKLQEDVMIDKIGTLAGSYLKCLWVNENKSSFKIISSNIIIEQSNENVTKAKVEYAYIYSLKEDCTQNEKCSNTEYFYLKHYNQKWYLEKSELLKKNKNL